MKLFDILCETVEDDPFVGIPISSPIDKLKHKRHLFAVLTSKRRRLWDLMDAATLRKDFVAKEEYERKNEIVTNQIDRLEQEIKTLAKSTVDARTTGYNEIYRSSFVGKTPESFGIDTGNPPEKVPAELGGKPKLDNPYWAGSEEHFAGFAYQLPFTPDMREIFWSVSEALKRNNIPGFTVAYGSTLIGNNGGRRRNFIAYAADGKFAWRRYDPQANGASMHHVFEHGRREMNIAILDTSDDYVQDKWLRQFFPEYFK